MSGRMPSMAYVRPEASGQASKHEQRPQMPMTQNPSSSGAVHHEKMRSSHGPSKDETHERRSTAVNFASSSIISSANELQTCSATPHDHKMGVYFHIS
ncbi:hypothetical protein AMTR_s00029p00108150 [Amborella trichopoda]|uniref:Uncharacterized protein n=1 Tax=Amborella trichopoda TaxID=13333 RepID=W1PP29_AMBTC|nr:hypothetical protein AMTR_s00029p00108150 [Amborella trichopoda]